MKQARPRAVRGNAERTREALVDAAMELFAEQGLLGPSLDAICAHAGYTRGAFYVHFKSRDELIVAVVGKAMGSFIDAMIGSGAGDDGVTAIVRTFSMAVRNGLFPIPGQVRPHQVLEACSGSEILRCKYVELLEDARDGLVEVIERGVAAKRIREDIAPEAIAQMMLALVLGVEVAADLSVPYEAEAVGEGFLTMIAP